MLWWSEGLSYRDHVCMTLTVFMDLVVMSAVKELCWLTKVCAHSHAAESAPRRHGPPSFSGPPHPEDSGVTLLLTLSVSLSISLHLPLPLSPALYISLISLSLSSTMTNAPAYTLFPSFSVFLQCLVVVMLLVPSLLTPVSLVFPSPDFLKFPICIS